MTEPPERRAIDDEQLAAPGRPVFAEADAVQSQAQERGVDTMLGRDGCDMGMVVLHGVCWQRVNACELEREPGAEEVGMQVVRDGVRLHVEHRAQMLGHVDQGVAGGRVVEVADMRRETPRRPA
jgi:hypothetical protein